ncbi:MAG TPA: adenylate/guanylate cyclase domain-containing protein [Leptospiraceae bacterium]|nr:adenylate/guanylate cyclase domain-containing protein [Leptospiraceae bacterium]
MHEGRKSIIYRGKKNDKPVIVKMLRNPFPSLKEVGKLRKEYEIALSLEFERIAKPISLENEDNFLALIYEDIGGEPLSRAIQKIDLGLKTKLRIAIQIVEALEFIHQNEVIHMDIKPDNIIVNLERNYLQVIDFGISTRLSRENPYLSSPENLEGTLVYISPEQTGRMNRSVDYRTDFYSLGVTLYELFTGTLPFNSEDSMEIVHYHIAVQPQDPYLINPEINANLSSIILRLMAKNAEDRYQSAHGLKWDLEKCLEVLYFPSQYFELGTHDRSVKFQIPQKLYGRLEEIEILLNAFYNVSVGNSQLMIVKGFSGIGKSVLVNEIHKPIVEKRGYFISGKFDQFKRDIPSFAIIQACRELVKQILTESEENIYLWKQSLLQGLGTNAQIIIDIIPELELILGEQHPILELNPSESKNRFNLVFKEFLKVFTTAEHPLVLFIDDMQWADFASLKLMEGIITDSEIKYLLFICSYRDNEVKETHPLLFTLASIKASKTKMQVITLKPLNLIHITELIKDTLKGDTDNPDLQFLADIVIKKTEGNPFFINEFLKTLYREKNLNFNTTKGIWEWDSFKIESMGITDNVIELMGSRIQKLSRSSKHLLQIASCIGSSFNLNMLVLLTNVSICETLYDLAEILKEELILVIGDGYKYILETTEIQDLMSGKLHSAYDVRFKFLHDCVQQASYSLIPEQEKKQVHLTIGRLIMNSLTIEFSGSNEYISTPEAEENIFDIVNHLNIGMSLISEEKERLNLARLNLIAANKARAATAYEGSQSYLVKALSLLTDKNWVTDYIVMLQLHHLLIELEFLRNNPKGAENFSNIVLEKAKFNSDKIRVFELKAYFFSKIGEFDRGLDTVVEALKLIKYKLKRNPQKFDVIVKLIQTKLLLSRYSFEKILNLPLMVDKDKLDATKFYILGGAPAYILGSNVMPIVVFEACMLTTKYGISPYTSYAFVAYGLILCSALGDIENGYKYGELSFKLLDRVKSKEMEPRVNHVFFALIKHWKDSLRSCIGPIQENTNIALNVGDYEYYAFSLCMYFAYKVYVGEHLKSIYEECIKYTNLYREKMEAAIQFVAPNIEYSLKLMEPAIPDNFELSGNYFDGDWHLPHMKEKNQTGFSFYFVAKIHLTVLFKDYALGLKWLDESKLAVENAALGMYNQVRYYFFKGIIHAKLIENKIGKKSFHERELNYVLKKFKKWAKHCPANHEYSYLFLKALYLALRNKQKEVSILFEQSIKLADENGFINDVALINELAADYYYSIMLNSNATIYLLNARHAYYTWGAAAKVKDIDERFPELLKSAFFKLRNENPVKYAEHTTFGKKTTTLGTHHFTTQILDFNSIFKASLSLSGEIVLEKLLTKLMRLLLENAGATNGYLLFYDGKQMKIEASGSISGKEIQVMQSIPLKSFSEISSNIVNYVLRTGENIVLNDALNEGNFTNDLHIRKKGIHSVLCAPIINQGNLVGIIYLENNLTARAFTTERIEVLQVIASQAAISIDNAKLYENLEQNVEERTQKLNEALAQAEEAKQEREKTRQQIEIQKNETDGINGLVKKINSVSSLEEIMNFLIYFLAYEFKISIFWLLFVDQTNEELSTFSFDSDDINNESIDFFRKFTVPLKKGSGLFYETYIKQKILSFNTEEKKFFNRIDLEIIEKGKFDHLLQVPLVIHEKVIGILCLHKERNTVVISPKELISLQRISDHIAGAMYNSYLYKSARLAREVADFERQRSDKLLLNILPKVIAEELKTNGKVTPVHFQNASIMFTDFRGFTQIAEKLRPEELIKELDACFTQFDKITERFNLEKLKTIGDSYMCVGGIPRVNDTHAIDSCLAALEIQAFMNQMKQIKETLGLPFWELRLGIHSGHVMAGVVGEKKFTYDIWGDTVNIASRMESSGTVGKINISFATYELVKDYFVCDYRGEVAAKNKGKVKMYYLNQIRPDYSKKNEGLVPNENFWRNYLKIQAPIIPPLKSKSQK